MKFKRHLGFFIALFIMLITITVYAVGSHTPIDGNTRGNKKLTANWTANSVKVTFDPNGGTGSSTQTFTSGKGQKFADTGISRTGYTLIGWSDNNKNSKQYDVNSGVADDWIGNGGTRTVYACWKANTYTVKFNANGASGTMANESFAYDVSKALTANAFSQVYTVTLNANGGSVSTTSLKSTWAFSKWTTAANGSGSSYTNGQSVRNLATSGTVNLYAQWTKPAVTLPTPSRTGYTFKGWSTSNTATSGITGAYTPSSSTTLYATWAINQYTVTRQFRLQNADGTWSEYTQIDSKAYNYGTKVPAWSRAVDTTYNAALINEYTVEANNNTLSVDVTRRTATNTIQVRYQNTDGSYGSYSNAWTGNLRVGESHTWSRSADATYKAASASITGTASNQVVQVTVDRVSYTVTFNTNNGYIVDYENQQLVETTNVTDLAGTTLGEYTFEIKRLGYNFDGWSTTANGARVPDNTQFSNTTYYARWVPWKANIYGVNVTSENYQSLYGTAVNYRAGQTWRIFYVDIANYFGDGYGTVYLKMDPVSKYIPGQHLVTSSDKFFVMNKNLGKATSNTLPNTNGAKATAYLANSAYWTGYATADASYAIGAPSAEMFQKSYGSSTTFLRGVGLKGYALTGKAADNANKANNMYFKPGLNYWICSPLAYDGAEDYLMAAMNNRGGNRAVLMYGEYLNDDAYISPVVCLKVKIK